MACTAEATTREAMKSFWASQAKNADLNEMLLDSQGEELNRGEIPEILGYLPNLKGKRILELACGIGRFTGHLAKEAKHVTAVDFMEMYVAKGRELNKAHTNITFIADDAMNLNFEKNSFDILFTASFLMYLNDEEFNRIMEKLLNWLTDDGFLFFRESCYGPMGNVPVDVNPTYYRNPAQLNRLFRSPWISGQTTHHLEVMFTRHLLTVIKVKKHTGTICWLLQRCGGGAPNGDGTEYSNGDEAERVGPQQDVTGTDSQLTERNHLKMLDLQPGQVILHVGCGDGGLDFHMAAEYGVHVHAIDSSYQSIEAAWERKGKEAITPKIWFEIGDVNQRPFPAEYFDVIYIARDIVDDNGNTAKYDKFVTWLKPGRKLLVRGPVREDSTEIPVKELMRDDLRVTYNNPDQNQISWIIAEKTEGSKGTV